MSTTTNPLEAWAANLILSGVNRLDCALTAFGCVMMDLDDDQESEDSREVATIRWLYDVLREEADNIRACVRIAQDANSCTAQLMGGRQS